MKGETIAVRGDEGIDSGALREFLRGRIEGSEGEIAVEQFPNGHSNLTYLLRIGGREYVLRRPPLGPVAPKAHDMAREYRVLRAIHPYFPEAPEPIAVCEDAAVLGAPFFLMERRRGRVLREDVPADLAPQAAGEAFLDCLARLHAIELSTDELRALGRPEGYVERQVHGWAERWNRARTEESPDVERVVGWLAGSIPPAMAPTLIHNDYKLDNVMFAGGAARVEAVLDWEMATIGDPLSDFGLTLCYWTWAAAPEFRVAGIPALTAQPGWLARDEMVAGYARRTGRDVAGIGYYEVLGVFKLAVIIQQIYSRYRRGQTHDERFKDFGQRARGLAELAGRLAEEQD